MEEHETLPTVISGQIATLIAVDLCCVGVFLACAGQVGPQAWSCHPGIQEQPRLWRQLTPSLMNAPLLQGIE